MKKQVNVWEDFPTIQAYEDVDSRYRIENEVNNSTIHYFKQ